MRRRNRQARLSAANQPVSGPAAFAAALEGARPRDGGFGETVGRAAEAAGGEMLFDMPAGATLDASRIAAVRLPKADGSPDIVFALLDQDGHSMRLAEATTVDERFHGFAQAFVGVLERLLGSLRAA